TLLSSNDYLGFASHREIVAAARDALLHFGASTASVRFISGTQSVHDTLETDLARFHGTESALSYSSFWAANTGLFATITSPGDVILSDALNHARLVAGIRARS